jgi:hypothetical protein
MTSIHSLLPPDCRNHIFSYLKVKDCFKYGRCSKTALQHVLGSLQQKRHDSFFARHAYPPMLHRERKIPLKIITDDQASRLGEDWQVLPTVASRIQKLYRALPAIHPEHDRVRALVLDLKEPIPPSDSDVSYPTDFSTLISTLMRLCKAHKLHATILSNVIRNVPEHFDPSLPQDFGSQARPPPDSTSLSVSLERYMGDVLISCYLMAHSIAGLLREGAPTEAKWVQKLQDTVFSSCLPPASQRHQEDMDDDLFDDDSYDDEEQLSLRLNARGQQLPLRLNATGWYHVWVYYHSTVLRISLLTSDQQERLGIDSSSGITLPGGLVQPHAPFYGSRTNLTRMVTSYFTVQPRAAMRTTLNHFGPLGPAFRGRDEILSRVMEADDIVYCINSAVSMGTANASLLPPNPLVLQWMMDLYQECKRTRPMTVVPPVVRIEEQE